MNIGFSQLPRRHRRLFFSVASLTIVMLMVWAAMPGRPFSLVPSPQSTEETARAEEYVGHDLTGLTAGVDYVAGTMEVVFSATSGLDTLSEVEDHIDALAAANSVINSSPVQSVIPAYDTSTSAKNYLEKRGLGMDRAYILTVSSSADLTTLLRAYSKDPNIATINASYIRHTTTAPNDPYFTNPPTEQPAWNLDHLNAETAWDTTTGSNEVIIAIADDGFQYNHPDLLDNVWQNLGEDHDEDGHTIEFSGGQWVYDPGDLADSIDDDANGKVNDLVGWHFGNNSYDVVDAAGHGTAVAGTAAAATNNSVGVAASCWNCKLMLLGGIGGISQRVTYAVDNGAQVINFSYGGTGYSGLETLAVQYAENHNVTLVGAAGNLNSNTKFYPAAYDGVISVAGILNNDTRAYGPDGSSYGGWVDVAAPWTAWTTVPNTGNGLYFYDSGTSIAAPQVTAAVALLKSRYPTLTNDQVRSVIHSSVNAVSSSEYVGTGQIDLDKVVNRTSVIPIAKLDAWLSEQSVTPHALVTITGKATSPSFDYYRVEYGAGAYPSSWTLLTESTTAVTNGPLATLYGNTLPSGSTVALRLTVVDTSGATSIDQTVLLQSDRDVLRTNGAIKGAVALGDMDNDNRQEIVASSYDGSVYAWNDDGSVISGWPQATGGYLTSSPALADLDGNGYLDVVAGSSDGKVYAWKKDGTALNSNWPKTIGTGVNFTSPIIVDLDQDGQPDIVMGSNNSNVYAWHTDGSAVSGWPKTATGAVNYTPAVGDLDGDGKLEVVATSGNKLIAWHQNGSIAIQAYTLGGNVLASPVLGNLDGDAVPEIVVSTGSQDSKVYALNFDTSAVSGWPKQTGNSILAAAALADLDEDGDLDVIVGSSDKKVYAWKKDGTTLGSNWPVTLSENIGSSSPAVGDVNGDGNPDVVIGTINIGSVLASSMFALNADGTAITSGWPKTTPTPNESSPSLADLDDDGTIEIVMGSGTSGFAGFGSSAYIWWTNANFSTATNLWPTFQHDFRRTGLAGKPCGLPINGQCSSSQPQICSNGSLVPLCGVCGCSSSTPVCLSSGYCSQSGGGGSCEQGGCHFD